MANVVSTALSVSRAAGRAPRCRSHFDLPAGVEALGGRLARLRNNKHQSEYCSDISRQGCRRFKPHGRLLCQPAQRDDGPYRPNSRETRRFRNIMLPHISQRFPQMFTGSNDLTHDNFTTFFAVSPPRPSARVFFYGSAEQSLTHPLSELPSSIRATLLEQQHLPVFVTSSARQTHRNASARSGSTRSLHLNICRNSGH